jgi:cytochrome c551/c552
MPYKSKAQQGYMHAHEGEGSITPAVVQEFDDASKGVTDLPEHVSDGPGATHHGQLATHHAVLAKHYTGKAGHEKETGMVAHLKNIATMHKNIGAAHAQLAQAEASTKPDPKRQLIIRTQTAAAKRGLMKTKQPTGPTAAGPRD